MSVPEYDIDHETSSIKPIQGPRFNLCASKNDQSKLDSLQTYYILVGRYSRIGTCLGIKLNPEVTNDELIDRIKSNLFIPTINESNIIIPYDISATVYSNNLEKLEIILHHLKLPCALIKQLKSLGIEKAHFYVGKDEKKTGKLPFSVLYTEPSDNEIAKMNCMDMEAPFKTNQICIDDLLEVINKGVWGFPPSNSP